MKRLDIKIENLVKLIEDEERLKFVGEYQSVKDFSFSSGLLSDFRHFIKIANKIGEGQYAVCYEKDGIVFKISKVFLQHLKTRDQNNAICPDYNLEMRREYSKHNLAHNYLHIDKMEKIMEKKRRHNFIYNSLPINYITYGKGKYSSIIGVVYIYHKDYKCINNLINDNWETILNVLVNLGKCQKELIDAGIFYNDFSTGNILYKDNDVKIIDFDVPNPEFYGGNYFDELVSFKEKAKDPLNTKRMEERNNYLYHNSYERLMSVLQTILDIKMQNDLGTNPFELEDYSELRQLILDKTILQCNNDGLLELINNYIQSYNKKNRTR